MTSLTPNPDAVVKAAVLAEALPYMRRYAGQTLVVKYGGHAMGGSAAGDSFARDAFWKNNTPACSCRTCAPTLILIQHFPRRALSGR